MIGSMRVEHMVVLVNLFNAGVWDVVVLILGNFFFGEWNKLLIDAFDVFFGHLEGWGKSCLQVVIMVLNRQVSQFEEAEKLVGNLNLLALKPRIEVWEADADA